MEIQHDLINKKFRDLADSITKFSVFYQMDINDIREEIKFELPSYDTVLYAPVQESKIDQPFFKENEQVPGQSQIEKSQLYPNISELQSLNERSNPILKIVSMDEYIEYYLSSTKDLFIDLEKLTKNTIYEIKYTEIFINFRSWTELFIYRSSKLLTSKFGIFTSIMTFLFGLSHGNLFIVLGLGGGFLSTGYLMWNKMFYSKDKEIENYKTLIHSLRYNSF